MNFEVFIFNGIEYVRLVDAEDAEKDADINAYEAGYDDGYSQGYEDAGE